MHITHKIDDFFKELFPNYKKTNDLQALKNEIANYYTYAGHKPTVSVDGEWVTVDIDTTAILKDETDFRSVVAFCEKGKYKDAKKLLQPLIARNPSNSDYHRIMGQILSDEGEADEAINCLIDALRWNPKNGYALVMVGNIFSRSKNDIDTAMTYYNQALAVNPDDHIALNNIGANLLQIGKTVQGIEYLEKAYAINPNYPNTAYGLALAYEREGYPLVAFDYSIKCMKASGKPQEGMYKSAYETAINLASELIQGDNGTRVFNEYKVYLENETGVEIKDEQDSTIPTAAKIEFAENYDRDYHLIKYKPTYPAVQHLMMHELVHLQFAHEARKENTNMLFMSGREMKNRFIRDNEKDLKRLEREGYPAESLSNFMVALYDGINRQVYNAPIDLFIEDYLFENYPELHPYQFISLNKLVNEGLEAITNKKAIQLTPKLIFTASKVLNLLNAIQFKDLYGIDLIKQFNPLPMELKEAERMWAEYLEYRKDRKHGEEYELIQHWGEDLRLENYFELVDEEDYRNRPKTVEQVMESMQEDPFGTNVDKNFKEREMDTFMKSQEAIGLNMAVMSFMVDALQYFKNMPQEKIKAIAFEIAMLGTQGINPSSGTKYTVNSIKGKEFSGYHLLAFYYVSWKLAIPEMLKELKLPYDAEYESAYSIYKNM